MAAKKDADQKPDADPKPDNVTDENVDQSSDAPDEPVADEKQQQEEVISEAEAEAEIAQVEGKAAEQSVEKRGGFVPALIGGVIAAAIGFAAGRTDMILPGGSDPSQTIAELEAKLADQAVHISNLSKSVQDLSDLSGDSETVATLGSKLDPIESDLGDVKSSIEALTGKVDPLASRLSELEKRPITEGASSEAVAAYEAELQKLQESLAAQRAEVEKMVADAQALEAKAAVEATAATNAATISRLHGQLDAGVPFDDLLAELKAGGVDVPDALSAPADKGVATIAALSASFAPAARAALADARGADKGTGLIAFLERQTGARSVSPQDGDDPDAILSRADAALTNGDLSGALTELKSLPEAAQTAMADWEQSAQTRLSAVSAADALAQSVNSN